LSIGYRVLNGQALRSRRMRWNMKYIKFFLTIILAAAMLCSCSNRWEGYEDIGFDAKLSPPDKNVFDLVKARYEYEQLVEIGSFKGTIDELNKQYPIECLREKEYVTLGTVYTAYYMGEYEGLDRIVTASFDEFGKKVALGMTAVTKYKSDFDGLEVGKSTLDDVLAVDPEGVFPMIDTGTGKPYKSIHMTKDGYLIIIEYFEPKNWYERYEYNCHEAKITNITVELI